MKPWTIGVQHVADHAQGIAQAINAALWHWSPWHLRHERDQAREIAEHAEREALALLAYVERVDPPPRIIPSLFDAMNVVALDCVERQHRTWTWSMRPVSVRLTYQDIERLRAAVGSRRLRHHIVAEATYVLRDECERALQQLEEQVDFAERTRAS